MMLPCGLGALGVMLGGTHWLAAGHGPRAHLIWIWAGLATLMLLRSAFIFAPLLLRRWPLRCLYRDLLPQPEAGGAARGCGARALACCGRRRSRRGGSGGGVATAGGAPAARRVRDVESPLLLDAPEEPASPLAAPGAAPRVFGEGPDGARAPSWVRVPGLRLGSFFMWVPRGRSGAAAAAPAAPAAR
jgi:hypothetical protein